MHARPPETTDAVAPKAEATAPDSASPIRGPAVTTVICRPIRRPRSASAAASWMIVPRPDCRAAGVNDCAVGWVGPGSLMAGAVWDGDGGESLQG